MPRRSSPKVIIYCSRCGRPILSLSLKELLRRAGCRVNGSCYITDLYTIARAAERIINKLQIRECKYCHYKFEGRVIDENVTVTVGSDR